MQCDQDFSVRSAVKRSSRPECLWEHPWIESTTLVSMTSTTEPSASMQEAQNGDLVVNALQLNQVRNSGMHVEAILAQARAGLCENRGGG